MEYKKIYAKADRGVAIHVAPGHFATNHSHINYYVDLTQIKTHQKMAKRAGALLAGQYANTQVDTIICLEGTNMLGAFMAEELAQASYTDMNSGVDVCVLTPEMNANNQMIFRENTQGMVYGQNVVLLLSSVSTGKTIVRTMDCLNYYGGRLAGVCAVFSAIPESHGIHIDTIFTAEDIPSYLTYLPEECTMCATHQKLDAIVNSYGYLGL